MLEVEELACSFGFDHVAAIDVDAVVTSRELAASCSPQSCQKYGSCWTCPPGAGTYEEMQAHITSRSKGVLVQTFRDNVDYYEDWEILDETRTLHNDRLDRLAQAMRAEFDNVVKFSTGGCDVCASCSYPDAPCKRPDEQRLSLSAHGVAVGMTCQNAGMDYSFENGRVRFIGMVLYG